MSNSVDEGIIKSIKEMPENEAKNILATLLLNYSKIGRNTYTKEQCFQDYDDIYRDLVMKNTFGV